MIQTGLRALHVATPKKPLNSVLATRQPHIWHLRLISSRAAKLSYFLTLRKQYYIVKELFSPRCVLLAIRLALVLLWP